MALNLKLNEIYHILFRNDNILSNQAGLMSDLVNKGNKGNRYLAWRDIIVKLHL